MCKPIAAKDLGRSNPTSNYSVLFKQPTDQQLNKQVAKRNHLVLFGLNSLTKNYIKTFDHRRLKNSAKCNLTSP